MAWEPVARDASRLEPRYFYIYILFYFIIIHEDFLNYRLRNQLKLFCLISTSSKNKETCKKSQHWMVKLKSLQDVLYNIMISN